jgi:two-component system CheB/CheR fusion protein
MSNDPKQENRLLREQLAGLQCAHDALAEQANLYRDLYEYSPDGCITADTETGTILTCNHSASSATGHTKDELLSMSVLSLYPDEEHERMQHIFATVSDGVRVNDAEFQGLRKDGSRFTMSLSITPVYNANGKVVAGRGVVRDISDRKDAEIAQQRLLHELDHRVKNALANVQAIADQTARNTDSLPAFMERFRGRLNAMSNIHVALSSNHWKGVDISKLVDLSIMPFADRSRRIILHGANIGLSLEATRSLGMVLHELATNASKYGALSVATGNVDIHWEIAGDKDRRHLRLDWTESGGPEVHEPSARGFGRQLIEESIAYELGGNTLLNFSPGGVRCTLEIPLASDDIDCPRYE